MTRPQYSEITVCIARRVCSAFGGSLNSTQTEVKKLRKRENRKYGRPELDFRLDVR